jgi:hypothetical protein
MTPKRLLALSLSMIACGGSGGPEIQPHEAGQRSVSVLKACRAEVPSNVNAIKKTESMHDAALDQYVAISAYPTGPLPDAAQPWGRGNTGFNTIGWKASGLVRGVYSVSTTRPSTQRPGGDFEVIGRIDCDGDGVPAEYTATKSLRAKATTDAAVY